MRYHNMSRNQDFDTDWISDMTDEQTLEMVLTLHAYGYITYKKVQRQYHSTYLCRLTSEGMKFCNTGGFKAQEQFKRKKRNKLIGEIIAIIASLATIATFIWQVLSK